MDNLTAVIITKNEQDMIEGCLKSLHFLKNIIVVDNNSSDKTCEIAQKYLAKVYKHSLSDFAAARDLGRKKVSTEWLLYVDADERVSPSLAVEITDAINNKNFSAYYINRRNYYMGREWPYREKIIRLFRRNNLKNWIGEIHESPCVEGSVGFLNEDLIHLTHKNIELMFVKTIEWSAVEAKLRFQTNHPKITWWRLLRVFITGFYNSYFIQKGFKAGIIGFVESVYQGFSMFITYVRLWELQTIKK